MTPVTRLAGIVRVPEGTLPVWWLPPEDTVLLAVGPSQRVGVLPVEERVLALGSIDVRVNLLVARPMCALLQAIVLVGTFRCARHEEGARWHALALDAHMLESRGEVIGAQGAPRRSARVAREDADDLAEAIRRRIVVVSQSLASGQVGHA
jgi:hypothetical protein